MQLIATPDRKSRRAFADSSIIAAVVAAVLFAAFGLATDESGLRGPGNAGLLLLIGMAASLLAIAVLALPTFLILARLQLANVGSTLAAGLAIGALLAGITEWPQTGLAAFVQGGWSDHAVRRICVLAVIGAISASCFWLTWTRKTQKGR